MELRAKQKRVDEGGGKKRREEMKGKEEEKREVKRREEKRRDLVNIFCLLFPYNANASDGSERNL